MTRFWCMLRGKTCRQKAASAQASGARARAQRRERCLQNLLLNRGARERGRRCLRTDRGRRARPGRLQTSPGNAALLGRLGRWGAPVPIVLASAPARGGSFQKPRPSKEGTTCFFCTENGSRQGQTLALTSLVAPFSLDTGHGWLAPPGTRVDPLSTLNSRLSSLSP